MTTITKERLLTIKQWRETYGPGSNVVLPAEEAEELARIALAALEVEPIGFRCRRNDNLGDWSYVYHREPDDFERKHLVIEGIYAAPPAPVVPEEKPMPNPLSMYAVDAVAAIAEVRGWNACRAAMLHSAEPASNHEELPLDYLQGQKDGLEWAAQLAEANHPQTGDWLYDDPLELAKAIRKGPDMPEFDGPTPITPEAIENAIEYIRSIAFHIDEDDYHGKHIAYFMRQALVWLEGHSCSDDRQGKAENQPVRVNQAAESNRGNEWTGNPDIDNAIIMLDRIDTLESCDDDRIEAVKTVLRRLAGNYPVTPDGWISCSEQMPEETGDIIVVSDGIVMSGISYSRRDGFYMAALEYDDDEPIGGVTHWMPLPEPPQG
ncbi:DUF551 domain-containing protein [Escherichia coli]|nr:DUF551 domain-containing protein [Escherichia coli]